MKASQFKIELAHRRGPPEQPPDPAYPNGKDLDLIGTLPACTVKLPYPAEERGVWMVECSRCGLRIAVTAAGRIDDPRTVRVSCKGSPPVAVSRH